MADLSQLPARYPQSDLTLSAAPCNERDTNLSPAPTGYRLADTEVVGRRDLTRNAVRRLLDTRRRIDRRMWTARAAVIRDQLQVMRQTYA